MKYVFLSVLLLMQISAQAADLLYVSAYDESGSGLGNILKVSTTGVASAWNINWDNGQQLEDPEGLAMDTQGNLYVNDGLYVFKIDPAGNGTTFATKPNVYYGYGMAVDAAGNVYAGGAIGFDYAVYKYSSAGLLLTSFTIPTSTDFTMGPDGFLYAVENFNSTIGKYDPVTGARTQYAVLPDGTFPSGLAFDAEGKAFTAGDYSPARVYEIGEGGTPVEQLSSFTAYVTFGLDVDDLGNIYTGFKRTSSNSNRNRIMKTDADGNSTQFSQLAANQRPNDVLVVPEPQTWLLLAVGLGLVGFALRRRRIEQKPFRRAQAVRRSSGPEPSRRGP
jgi:sugar lactone lactonase YvrE